MTQILAVIDASRPTITVGVGSSSAYTTDIAFARGNFTSAQISIKASEELGLLDTDYVEDYDGVDGYMTLRRLSDDLRVSFPAVAVPAETPDVDNDVWRITVPLASVNNEPYELEGRVRDIIGNYTIFGSVATPIGGEDIESLSIQFIEGFALQYTQLVGSVSVRAILEVIGAERAE